jgi:hypothetical protein
VLVQDPDGRGRCRARVGGPELSGRPHPPGRRQLSLGSPSPEGRGGQGVRTRWPGEGDRG